MAETGKLVCSQKGGNLFGRRAVAESGGGLFMQPGREKPPGLIGF